MSDGRYEAWRRVLLGLAVLGVLQGLTWVALGSFDPLGWWDAGIGAALYGGPVPAEARPLQALLVAILGATNAGFFVLVAFLVAVPLRRRERWAWNAVASGLLAWYVVDSAASIGLGAAFNAAFVNTPALVLYGVPLLALRPGLAPPAPERPR